MNMYRKIEIVVEHHPGGYTAYPQGMKGIVVGKGDSYAEALDDAKSAIQSYVESFGGEAFAFDSESPVLFNVESQSHKTSQ